MLPRLLLALAVLALAWWLLHRFLRTPPEKVAAMLRQGALYGAIAMVILLAVTGRMHWLFAALGVAIPFVQRLYTLARTLPALRQLFSRLGARSSGTTQRPGSSIETQMLRMTLDHSSGEMSGEVLAGAYAGRALADLRLQELKALLAQCRASDAQSVALLEAYLDRMHGEEWREQDADSGQDPGSGPMTREEAYQVLGLAQGAPREDIVAAHRRLMQKLHPDRGGSNYLAAKINQAKDFLLAE